jgi:hypothetical protein
MSDDRDENPARIFSGRRRCRLHVSCPSLEAPLRCVGISLDLSWYWLLSPGKILDFELGGDDRALDVVPLLGVSCLETWLGGPTLRSFDDHRCPSFSSAAQRRHR